MNKTSILLTVICSVFVLQSLHTGLRLLGKSYGQFSEQDDFIIKVERLYAANENRLQPYSMFYMRHGGEHALIRNYFASQYAMVPKLISDKKQHQSLVELQLTDKGDGELDLTVLDTHQ